MAGAVGGNNSTISARSWLTQFSIPAMLINLLNIDQFLLEIGRRNKNKRTAVFTFAKNLELVASLLEYDELEGIAWEWQSLDGAMTKAPLALESVGRNPTDRGKKRQ